MPYDNEYNRKIKSEYQNINKRYVEHQKLNDQLFHHTPMVSGLASKRYEGGAIPKFLNSDVEYGINQGSRVVYGDASQYGSNEGEKNATTEKLDYANDLDKEKPMGGKGGYARGTFRDTGFERTLGAGKRNKGVKEYKKKEPLKLTKKMEGGTELGLPQKFVKKGGARKKKNNTELEGGNFLSDLWSGIKTVASPLASVAKVGLSMVPDPRAQMASTVLGAMGAGKKRGRPSKMSGGKLVPVANMKSSSMAGQGKKNKRSEIVKNIMKEKGLSMIQASKYVKEHKLY